MLISGGRKVVFSVYVSPVPFRWQLVNVQIFVRSRLRSFVILGTYLDIGFAFVFVLLKKIMIDLLLT